jgi:hypothetical protein
VTISAGGFYRSRRRWLLFAVVASVIVVFSLIDAKMTHGGPVYWWDQATWGIRDVIRTLWSMFTGQPVTRDLLPF